MFREFTDGNVLMFKFQWIEEIMMLNCCTKAKANGIFKLLVEQGKLWEIKNA